MRRILFAIRAYWSRFLWQGSWLWNGIEPGEDEDGWYVPVMEDEE